jgi:photosystem II stability/assembly factor-like uncharacterized protein
MRNWFVLACASLGAGLGLAWAAHAQDDTAATQPASKAVVEVRSDRIVLLDIARIDHRLIAVGERGFTLISDDEGKSWKGVQTPVSRTLTGMAFRDDKVGIAVGHGGSLIRTEDGGRHWVQVPMEEAGTDSLLGVTHLGGDHFAAYGAFGLYFDSQDAGRTWTRVMVGAEDFDRHISQVVTLASGALLLVAESGTLARSDDGGATWTTLVSPYQGSYFGAVAVPDGSVVVFGMRGNIYRSTDQGATWEKVELHTTTSLMSGRVLGDGRILLVGNSGLLALSKDAGKSFELHSSKRGKGFAAFVESDGSIILVGESGITPLDPAWLGQ